MMHGSHLCAVTEGDDLSWAYKCEVLQVTDGRGGEISQVTFVHHVMLIKTQELILGPIAQATSSTQHYPKQWWVIRMIRSTTL